MCKSQNYRATWTRKTPFGKLLSPEYRWATNMSNPHWRFVRAITLRTTFGRCAVLGFLGVRADQVDHLNYRVLKQYRPTGNSLYPYYLVGIGEIPWIDVVPLNKHVHSCVTVLRRMGLKPIVNMVLRISYAMWFLPWIFASLFVLHLVHVVPWSPFLLAQEGIIWITDIFQNMRSLAYLAGHVTLGIKKV